MEVYFYDIVLLRLVPFFFFKHKTAYDMRIIDGSSDLCSSDLYFHDEESAGENEGEHQHPAVRIFAVIMRRRCRNIGLAGHRIIQLVGHGRSPFADRRFAPSLDHRSVGSSESDRKSTRLNSSH